MTPRGGATEAGKARRHKAVQPKHRGARKIARDRKDSRSSELNEAREQQAATAEVLRIIASSPGELQPVFDTILSSAVRLCEAKFGNLSLREGEAFRIVAMHGASPAWAQHVRERPVVHPPHPETALGRVARTRQMS